MDFCPMTTTTRSWAPQASASKSIMMGGRGHPLMG
jgi:hypothetical protein